MGFVEIFHNPSLGFGVRCFWGSNKKDWICNGITESTGTQKTTDD